MNSPVICMKMMLSGCYLYVQKYQLVQAPPKEAVGEAYGDGGGGEEKVAVWEKKAFNAQARWLGGGKGFLVCFAFFEQRGRFPVQALSLNVAWSY